MPTSSGRLRTAVFSNTLLRCCCTVGGETLRRSAICARPIAMQHAPSDVLLALSEPVRGHEQRRNVRRVSRLDDDCDPSDAGDERGAVEEDPSSFGRHHPRERRLPCALSPSAVRSARPATARTDGGNFHCPARSPSGSFGEPSLGTRLATRRSMLESEGGLAGRESRRQRLRHRHARSAASSWRYSGVSSSSRRNGPAIASIFGA